ncbi:MAG: DUF2085 domain-containing protein [Anaerolineales bacterium]|nr:DUF2085 domain-containing protein [Anaerolineales bacterium]
MPPEASPPPLRNLLQRIRRIPAWRLLLLAVVALILLAGLAASPPGLLGKADAIGYAVCHRIELRSLHLGDRPLPLCARCMGTFLGTIVGALILIAGGRGRSAVWPSRGILFALAVPVLLWGVDGFNSYVSLFPRFPHLYPPSNFLRMTTGTLLGLAMAVVFLPAVNQSLWKSPSAVPVLRNFRELFGYFLAAPILIGLVMPENPILLYPFALLSVAGILFLLTGVYLSLLLMVLRRENQAETWHDAWPAVAGGFALGLLQIYAIDIVRFQITHTWGGFGIGG